MKAALFDLDGVVVDTESQYTVFWGSMARKYRPDVPGLEYKIKGQTLTQIFDGWFPAKSVQAAIVDELNDFERNMQFPYINGIEAFLCELRHEGVKTAVVTSSNREKMQSVYLAHPQFTQLFDAILTSEDFVHSKPHPDCYLRAAAHFGVSPADCVGFEDSFNGLKSVRSAGMLTIALSTTNTVEDITPLSDYVIADYKSISVARLRQLQQEYVKKNV